MEYESWHYYQVCSCGQVYIAGMLSGELCPICGDNKPKVMRVGRLVTMSVWWNPLTWFDYRYEFKK